VIGLRCARLRAALVDFADGSLEDPERVRVERHVSACPDCAETVLALREVPAELGRRVRAAPDERFWAAQRRGIADAIDRGVRTDVVTHPAIRRPTLVFWRAVPALAAAALIAVLARNWMTTPAPQIAARPAVSVTSDESIAAFVEEPATVASVDVASLEDTTLAGMDESFEDTLAGYSDGNLI
jgi:anti-sigma factor RsiW